MVWDFVGIGRKVTVELRLSWLRKLGERKETR